MSPESLENIKEALRNAPVRITKAILFGSRARGDWLEDSDWDLMLVSPGFAGMSFPERFTFMLKTLRLSNTEYFCYTPEEFEERQKDELSFIKHILEEGVEIAL